MENTTNTKSFNIARMNPVMGSNGMLSGYQMLGDNVAQWHNPDNNTSYPLIASNYNIEGLRASLSRISGKELSTEQVIGFCERFPVTVTWRIEPKGQRWENRSTGETGVLNSSRAVIESISIPKVEEILVMGVFNSAPAAPPQPQATPQEQQQRVANEPDNALPFGNDDPVDPKSDLVKQAQPEVQAPQPTQPTGNVQG